MANGWQSAVEAEKRRKLILKLRAKGLRMEDIAAKVGVTRQRVGQVVADEAKRAAAAVG